MNALLVLYAPRLGAEAFSPVINGKNSVALAVEQGKKFPNVKKTVIISGEGEIPGFDGAQIEKKASWTKKELLLKIAELQTGFDMIYFSFADCPFLDPALADALFKRHAQNGAEYTYADGWPYGLAPEIISPGTAGILANILGGEDGPVERDVLFSVIQKDINSFDIEAEISAVDMRCHRLNFCADSKRNLLLINNFINAAGGKIPGASFVEKTIQEKPEILRTLPAFYPVQVTGACPQKCAYCPCHKFSGENAANNRMDSKKFEELLDKIIAFSGDAVVDLSLWGELSLHPEKLKLIEAVLRRKELTLVIETTGIGWKSGELEECSRIYAANPHNAFSWIVSLDTTDPQRYAQIHGQGFAEAGECAKKLMSLFGKNCYVQAVRVKGEEDDTEKFYRSWKEFCGGKDDNIIIQKYDDFCGVLEKRQASDISPLIRQPCWHIMRDMPVLIDGTVPLCREDLNLLKDGNGFKLGNVFTDSLESIWKNGGQKYIEQCGKKYSGVCADCDEYYTYNF